MNHSEMHTTNYTNTFIEVADDCPVSTAEIPPKKTGHDTIASLQYDMIKKNPYKYTSDDVIFMVFAKKNDLTQSEYQNERKKFFSKGQPCLRSSPLAKRYGWGVHSDAAGRVAIYARESPDYKKLTLDEDLKKLKAMRSKRA